MNALSSLCRRSCCIRSPYAEKPRPHTEQVNAGSVSWICMWRWRLANVESRLWQTVQSSSELSSWKRRCWLRLLWTVNAFPHSGQTYGFSFVCITWCRVRFPFARNSRPQIWQTNGRSPVCVRTWISRLLLDFNCRPHSEHRYCFRIRFGFTVNKGGNFDFDKTDGPFFEKPESVGFGMIFAAAFFFLPVVDTGFLEHATSSRLSLTVSETLICPDRFLGDRSFRFTRGFFFEVLDLGRRFFADGFTLASDGSVSSTSRSRSDKPHTTKLLLVFVLI